MKRNLSRCALAALASLLLAGAALAAPVPAPAAPQTDAAACLSAAPAAAVAQPAAPVWLADGKCAPCSELLKSCKAFCGTNNVTFNCQNSNPCAGTCTCTVPPA